MIEEASGTPNSLWPDDGRTRANIARWQCLQLAHWGKEGCQPLLFERVVKAFFNLGPCDAAVVAKAIEAFHRDARVLEAHLTKHPYLVGTGVTLADFSVVAPLFYTEKAELPLMPYPHIRDWVRPLQPTRLARHGARCRRA